MFRFNKLFSRVFLLFFLSCMFFLISLTLVFGRATTPFTLSMHEVMLMNIFEAGTQSFIVSNNWQKIPSWLKTVHDEKKQEMYLALSDGKIMGPKPIPIQVSKISKTIFNTPHSNKLIKTNNYLIGKVEPFNNKLSYRLIIAPNNKIHFEGSILILTFQILVSVLMSFLCCALLTKILIQPLTKFKKTLFQIARGNLHERIDKKLLKRKDEIFEVGRDINRMADKLEDLFKYKDRLLEDISHELRSPLARQQVALEILRPKIEKSLTKYIDKIELEMVALNELIQEILISSNLNKLDQPLKIEEFSLSDLLSKIADDANFEEGLLCVFYTAKTPINLMGDKRLIHRAVENIVRNSVRYAKGEKKVELNAWIKNEAVHITISDNGPGVSKEELPNIFEPFYRSHSSKKSNKSGYGLGLSIAKTAIDLHNGSISACNNEEGGLKIVITIPVINYT